jgi:hypothetical protein
MRNKRKNCRIKASKPNRLIAGIREEINAIVTRNERVNILAHLGCTETIIETGRIQRNDVVDDRRGQALLICIDQFDRACLRGLEDQICSMGKALMNVWQEHAWELGMWDTIASPTA